MNRPRKQPNFFERPMLAARSPRPELASASATSQRIRCGRISAIWRSGTNFGRIGRCPSTLPKVACLGLSPTSECEHVWMVAFSRQAQSTKPSSCSPGISPEKRRRRIYGPASTQHVGCRGLLGCVVDHHRWRKMGADHGSCGPAVPAPSPDSRKEVLALRADREAIHPIQYRDPTAKFGRRQGHRHFQLQWMGAAGGHPSPHARCRS